MMTDKEKQKMKLETLRTQLSVKQTSMACERSLLSYVRTACVFVSLAITYLKIASYDVFDYFVIIMLSIGFLFLIIGVVEYFVVMNKNKKIQKHISEEFSIGNGEDGDSL